MVQKFAEQVQHHKDELQRAGVPKEAFEQSLAGVQREIAKQTPDQAAVRGFVADVRNAVSGAAGNLIAEGVISLADKILT